MFEIRFTDLRGARRVQWPAGDWLHVGSGSDADVVVDEPTVSRRHAALRWAEGVLWVRDLGSRNGTRVAGQAVRGDAAVPLEPDAQLQLGDLVLQWRALHPDDADLGLPMPSERAGPAPVTERGAQCTRAPLPVEAFTRLGLPAILEQLARGCSRLALVGLVSQALLRHVQIAALSVCEPGDDAGTAVLFCSTPAPAPGCGVTRVAGLDWRADADDGDGEAVLTPLAALIAGLFLLVQEPGPAAPAVEPVVEARGSLDPAVQRLYRQARRAAGSGVSVLIRGESGTGKELFARDLHAAGPAGRPFVAVNCAALPDDLLEAELFGVEKGAATGVEARPGLFERADGGTLFLDEIGDMALATQARILRVLQEGEVVRVGGTRARPARVRVVSATHRPLEDMVADGRFRLDLLHRIADWDVHLPALRERPADIGPLALRFLAERARERAIAVRGISRRALDALQRYDWPGNIRELEREMGRIAVFLDHGAVVTGDDLRPAIRGVLDEQHTLEARVAAFERRLIEQALAAADGHATDAAKQLGISRSTLYRKLGQPDG